MPSVHEGITESARGEICRRTAAGCVRMSYNTGSPCIRLGSKSGLPYGIILYLALSSWISIMIELTIFVIIRRLFNFRHRVHATDRVKKANYTKTSAQRSCLLVLR